MSQNVLSSLKVSNLSSYEESEYMMRFRRQNFYISELDVLTVSTIAYTATERQFCDLCEEHNEVKVWAANYAVDLADELRSAKVCSRKREAVAIIVKRSALDRTSASV